MTIAFHIHPHLLQYKILTTTAKAPTKATPLSAGFDLSSDVTISIPAHGKALVATGLQLHIPFGCYGRIAPRSGLALHHFIDVGAGVVDADYRGEVNILLFNFNNQDFLVNQGDRIAQLICEVIANPKLEEITTKDDSSQTIRGSNGFGSSGLR